MQRQIIEQLSEITEEEQYILIPENPSPRSLYAKSGRFIIERRHMSHLSFGESTAAICLRPHPRFREFPTHSHDFIEIMYVCSGRITHVFGKQKLVLNTDELIVLGRDTKHSILAAGKNDIGINLIISTDLFEVLLNSLRQNSQLPGKTFENLLKRGGLPYCVFDVSDSLPVRNLMESMIHSVICERNRDGYILQQSLNLLLCYLASMEEAKEPAAQDSYEEKLKKKILNYIRTSYSTATLTEAAHMMGLSPSYLSRTVCQSFGMTFKELLMNERFDAARDLLRTTAMPIGDIINRVGYENSSYFHKEFKKRYSVTPGAYRKAQK
ncbi:MAG: helix-turn-helix domain-containing protein [Clostridia bacterium]|nr:helix-turn-helix domain-containing protein [Clostridia bacterium]